MEIDVIKKVAIEALEPKTMSTHASSSHMIYELRQANEKLARHCLAMVKLIELADKLSYRLEHEELDAWNTAKFELGLGGSESAAIDSYWRTTVVSK